jgi:hypothetical protein
MNKLPGAVGLGLGVAIGAGTMFGPANAESEKPVSEEVHCHTGYMVVGLGSIVEFPECYSASESHPMVSPSTEELNPGLQNDSSDFFSALGFLVIGSAGVIGAGYGLKKYVTYKVDAIHAEAYPVNSEPLPEIADMSELVAANRNHAARELESIARTYHIMQDAQLIEVDAAWIVSQAARSNEL